MGSGYGVPLDCGNLRVEVVIWQPFIFKELYWRALFSLLLKNKTKDLF
jgi:hypothetical protein